MTRAELLLGADAVTPVAGGLEIAIRQPWYRSLPLSSVVSVEVSVDGVVIDPEHIVFSLYGVDYALAEVGQHWQTVWFIQDAATLRVRCAHREEGADIDVALTLRFPYIIIEGVGPLQRRTFAHRGFAWSGDRS